MGRLPISEPCRVNLVAFAVGSGLNEQQTRRGRLQFETCLAVAVGSGLNERQNRQPARVRRWRERHKRSRYATGTLFGAFAPKNIPSAGPNPGQIDRSRPFQTDAMYATRAAMQDDKKQVRSFSNRPWRQGCPSYAEDDNEKGRTGGRTPDGRLRKEQPLLPATARREQQSFGTEFRGGNTERLTNRWIL